MMTTSETIANLERLRAELESQLQKLQVVLKHWQTWEAEYEGLKEELQHLPEDVTDQDLVNSATSL